MAMLIPLHDAAEKGDLKEIDFLLKAGWDINSNDYWAQTPLMWACVNGQLRTVKYLIKRGANIELPNKWGETPAFVAAKQKNKPILKFLIKNGANVNLKDARGRSALFLKKESAKSCLGRIYALHKELGCFLDNYNDDLDMISILSEAGAIDEP